MKHLLIGFLSLILTCGFAAEFRFEEAYKFVTNKNYLGLQEYLKTNNEYKSEQSKYQFTYCELYVKTTIAKEITKTNIVSKINDELKAGKINHRYSLTFLYSSRQIKELNISRLEAAMLTKTFYEQNSTNIKTQDLSVVAAFITLKEYDKLLAYLEKYQAALHPQIKKLVFSKGIKKFTVEQKITFIKMVTNNCKKYIDNAAQLSAFIDMLNTLNNQKYDEVVKPCLIILNRTYYSKISEGDTWKQALVKLQLTMKPYGL